MSSARGQTPRQLSAIFRSIPVELDRVEKKIWKKLATNDSLSDVQSIQNPSNDNYNTKVDDLFDTRRPLLPIHLPIN